MERIAPLAKILAEANGIDWQKLSGSGEGGMIVEQDILNYLSRIMSGEEEPPATPVDAPPPDWTGSMPSADLLKGAGVDSDIAAFVEQSRPTPSMSPAMSPAVGGVPAASNLDAEAMDFELDDDQPESPASATTPASPATASPAASTWDWNAPAPVAAAPEVRAPEVSSPSFELPEVQFPAATAPSVPSAAEAAGGAVTAAGLGSLLSRLYHKEEATPAPSAPEAAPEAAPVGSVSSSATDFQAPAVHLHAQTPDLTAPDAVAPDAITPNAPAFTSPTSPEEHEAVAPAAQEPASPAWSAPAEAPAHHEPDHADTLHPEHAEPAEQEVAHHEPDHAQPAHADVAKQDAHHEPVPAHPEPVHQPEAGQQGGAHASVGQQDEAAAAEAPATHQPSDQPDQVIAAPVGAPVAAPTSAERPAALPSEAVWFGTYLRRDASLGPVSDLRTQLTSAVGRDVPLAFLIARAAQRHLGTLGLNSVALHDSHGYHTRPVHGSPLREAVTALDSEHHGTPDLLVVDAGTLDLDDLHYPHTTTLSVGRMQGGHAALTLNGNVDTHQAAQFLRQVTETLEQPILLVL